MKLSLRPPRTPSSLSDSLNQQLNLYALAAGAAGVGILALAQPAEAKIVYTHAWQRLPVNGEFFLDLNHDGINDFKFRIAVFDHTCGLAPQDCSSQASASWVVYPQAARNQVVGSGNYAAALRWGTRIGSKGPFLPASEVWMGRLMSTGGGPRFYGPWAASGGVSRRFLGLKFVINGKTHYGWARFNVKFSVDLAHRVKPNVVAVLSGYAYETVANKPIRAGHTHGDNDEAVPAVTTPATLGELLLGRR